MKNQENSDLYPIFYIFHKILQKSRVLSEPQLFHTEDKSSDGHKHIKKHYPENAYASIWSFLCHGRPEKMENNSFLYVVIQGYG